MKKRAMVFFRRLMLVIAAVIFGVNLYTWNSRMLGTEPLPMAFGYGLVLVMSGSMEPTYSVNDVLLIREAENYEIGDVIVFRTDGMRVVHRIVDADDKTVQTQGDANNVADEPIAREDICGHVIGCASGLGALVLLIRKPVVALCILAAAMLLAMKSISGENKQEDEELQRIREEIRRLREEQDENNTNI